MGELTPEQKKLVEKALAWHPRGVYLCEPEIFHALISEVRRLRARCEELEARRADDAYDLSTGNGFPTESGGGAATVRDTPRKETP